jgi:hypothetical protein
MKSSCREGCHGPARAAKLTMPCLTFAAIYLLGNRSRVGFLIMMSGNLLWCVIGIWAQSYAVLIVNFGIFSMNVRGFIKWAKSQADTA